MIRVVTHKGKPDTFYTYYYNKTEPGGLEQILFLGLMKFVIFLQEWNDYNLRWNDTEYGNVKDLRITPNKIWRPDVLMYNR